MLKLIYDVKCGFEEVYVVEKDVEEDLTYWINTINESMLEAAAEIKKEDPEYKPEPYTEEELYEQYKDNIWKIQINPNILIPHSDTSIDTV